MTFRAASSALARAIAFAALLVCTVICCGCSSIAGSKDVELVYEAPATANEGRPDDLRALVLRRLGAGNVAADVTEDGRSLRIVVDETRTENADELVKWSGTVLVLEPDPALPITPRDPADLVARTTTHQDGSVEQYWEGSRAAIARAIDRTTVDRDHRVVGEPIWETASNGEPARWRTRVVYVEPRAELATGIFVGWGDSGTLRLRAQKDSPADTSLQALKTRAHGNVGTDVLVRGETSLGHPVYETDAIVVSFGFGIQAYARAQQEKQLLTTPRLPALRRVDAVGLPRNTELVMACIVVPILLSFAWLAFVRRFDRAHPEPMWLVLLTFVLGGLATVPAALLEYGYTRLSPWLDPRVVTFGGQLFALPLAVVVFTFVIGVSEEGSKFVGALFASRRKEFDEPVDGIVYGIVSSLGFAAAENIQYFAAGRLTAPLVVARCFMSIPAHMFFGAIWGYALGIRLVDRQVRVLAFFLVAALAHGLFDAFLLTDGTGGLAIALNMGMASLFIMMVRRALRHGVIDEASLKVKSDERSLYRVGRPGLFAISSVALHLLAFGIFVLGASYQMARHRPGLGFVGASSLMVLLLAVAAYGVSASMPLDVAVDAYGVTFAGAARAWRRIRGFSVHPGHVLLDCEDGPIRLGPASNEQIAALAGALTDKLGTNGSERHSTLECERPSKDVVARVSTY
ncbi:hypothetical protein AKJ09_09588 [Labilithrix luteola]|uniref:PrsW family intramembrane metalloprotease n=1 Tax=Labilithrix luteola TaxID=1391654 RepID=A0A0K1QBX0_9BACT|nr:PrsW family intramembrane metalloprotease [Labilithrix luteola]AKV02925.1 hypothetical protein AKJ09_09588 [Labilithrix luteola]